MKMNDLRLVIGNKNYSSWSMCPWLLLKMFDVDFEEIQIALYQDDTAEKLGPYSPSLKVPVLLHREITVWGYTSGGLQGPWVKTVQAREPLIFFRLSLSN